DDPAETSPRQVKLLATKRGSSWRLATRREGSSGAQHVQSHRDRLAPTFLTQKINHEEAWVIPTPIYCTCLLSVILLGNTADMASAGSVIGGCIITVSLELLRP
ncbi:hypothetical protein NP493_292g02028, partial [Ridgeia piscesae]